MSDEGGYVRVYRRVLDNPEFQDQSEALCFVWLIMKAAWKPTRVRYKDRVLDLKRGDVAISVRDFAKAMGRSKSWCFRFLEQLRKRDMVGTLTGTGVNVISLTNYDAYQIMPDSAGTGSEHQAGQERDRSGTQNKEGKEKKEGKEDTLAIANGGEPPNPEKVMWRSGVEYLVSHGVKEASARSLLGKWKGEHGVPAVIEALGKAHTVSSPDPKAYIEGVLRNGSRQPTGLRGTRPSPALELYRQGLAEEQAERDAQAADRGARPSLPALGSG